MQSSRPGVLLMLSLALFLHAGAAFAAETWKVTGGRTTFNFYAPLLEDLGIPLDRADVTAATPDPILMDIEPPYWSMAITPASDLRFLVENERFTAFEPGGTIRHRGGFALGDGDFRDWALEYVPRPGAVGGGLDGDSHAAFFFARGAGAGEAPGAQQPARYALAFADEMPIFRRDDHRLVMYATAKITGDWAQELGRPWLAGQAIARVEVAADVEYVSGASSEPPYVALTGSPLTSTLDVKLGYLGNITEIGRLGAYPGGTSGISMATSSCNVGDVDVPWHAPMREDHPGIAMALYRLAGGRFEQVGLSWMKHGFFALSFDECTPCMHPSDGTFLGVGCSDSYGVGNNGDRTYLGPRREWNPFLGSWECTGSFFAGYVPDCVRRVGGGGWDPVAHRLQAKDADLAQPGASYIYEAYYVVAGDANKHDNIGSRDCTMTWTGASWAFTTLTPDSPHVAGPAIERWGDLRSTVSLAPGDGEVILAVATTDLGGGQWHYEYALYNFDAWREVRKISLPVGPGTTISNIGFHDWDSSPANDWAMTLSGGEISWETTSFATDSTANALTFGELMNFRFDADRAPADSAAALFAWRPGPAGAPAPATRVPGVGATSVAASAAGATAAPLLRIGAASPNPLDPGTTIRFELARDTEVSLEIFGAEGRLVRSLPAGRLAAGAHTFAWDGADADGQRVAPGVYYYRLRAGGEMAAQSLVVVR